MIHQRKHPNLDVEGCFGCKVAHTSFGSNSTTSRGGRVSEIESTERRWAKDMDAYKRLRRDGLQPQQIDGSAALESGATEKWQVENLRQNPVTSRSGG